LVTRKEAILAKKIMVVDDEPNIVNYLVTLFSDNGYETCSAANGTEALEVLKREKPDLITLDLDMPEDAGPMVYRKMTKEDDFKDIPIIVVSGLSAPHRAIKKAAAVVNKPFDPDQMVKLVKGILANLETPRS
jgi:CheY-like chemotaxis protein